MQLLHGFAVALLCFAHPFLCPALACLASQLACTFCVLFCLLQNQIGILGFQDFSDSHGVFLHGYLAAD